MTTANSRAVTFCLVLLVVSASSIATAAGGAVITDQTTPGLFADAPDAVQYDTDGQLRPSFIVTVDGEDGLRNLQDWTNASDSRALFWTHTDETNTTTALIAAPAGDVGVAFVERVLNRGLATKDYVTQVDANRVIELDPVEQLQNESDVSLGVGILAKFRASRGDAAYSTDGIAFKKNAEAATMQHVRNVTGSSNVSAIGSGIVIAYPDTGQNVADGQILGNGSAGSDLRIHNKSKDFIENETVEDDGVQALEDPNGHGSFVGSELGSAAAEPYAGMAPNATLMPLRVLGGDGSGSQADVARAIRYAADNGADIVSLSLGAPTFSAAVQDAIVYARAKGTIPVIATGNSQFQGNPWTASPADTAGVIAVTATNATTNTTANEAANHAGVAYFAQHGPDPGTTDLSDGQTQGAMPAVGAPGMAIETRVPTMSGGVSVKELSGTSMSTPVVAGGIAQVLAEHPEWQGEPDAVRDRVKNSSRPAPNIAVSEVGGGFFATDLMNETVTPNSQESMMDDAAAQRNDFWKGLSDASGGWLPFAMSPEVAV